MIIRYQSSTVTVVTYKLCHLPDTNLYDYICVSSYSLYSYPTSTIQLSFNKSV